MKKFIIVNTDGGSRGNPGPAAIGVVFSDEKNMVIKEYGECIGEATNNEAEYQAVVFAIKKIKQLFGKKDAKNFKFEFRSDSELLIKQLNGQYKIEEPGLQPLFLKVWNLKIELGDIEFKHIPREENKRADRMVNEALDGSGKTQKLLI